LRRAAQTIFTPQTANWMEADMSMNIPVLPIGAGALSRAVASLAAVAAHWAKIVAKASRNRREARKLAGLDRHMLADIGLTRADVNDAFSEPFWEDPTALLRERAIERRMNRPVRSANREQPVADGFQQPRLDRPARHAV
jgi:uncharacterized protein YjiS (DUF1127 family)